MLTFLTHIALAFGLFYIMGWIGRHSSSFGYVQLSVFEKMNDAPAFNFIFRMTAPLVYILVVSSVLYSVHLEFLVKRIYLVVIYYFAIRYLFNIALGRVKLLDWRSELGISLLSISVAYALYGKLIVTRQRLIPDFDTISNELWIIVLIFLYSVLNKIQVSSKRADNRREKYLRRAYERNKKLYGKLIESTVQDARVEALVYAIMIYESFNRPRLVRSLERILFRFGKSRTIGLMQITTNKRISDEDSVELATQKILSDYNASYKKAEESEEALNRFTVRYQVFPETVGNYNPNEEYVNEVLMIYDCIVNEYYPNVCDQ